MRSCSFMPRVPVAKKPAVPSKKFFKADLTREAALALALEALVDAADVDVGTSGPDLVRGIYPVVKIVTCNGVADIADDELRPLSERLIAALQG